MGPEVHDGWSVEPKELAMKVFTVGVAVVAAVAFLFGYVIDGVPLVALAPARNLFLSTLIIFLVCLTVRVEGRGEAVLWLLIIALMALCWWLARAHATFVPTWFTNNWVLAAISGIAVLFVVVALVSGPAEPESDYE
jgi:hypothetical protein